MPSSCAGLQVVLAREQSRHEREIQLRTRCELAAGTPGTAPPSRATLFSRPDKGLLADIPGERCLEARTLPFLANRAVGQLSAYRKALGPQPIVARVIEVAPSVFESPSDVSEGLFSPVELDDVSAEDVAERAKLPELHQHRPIRM